MRPRLSIKILQLVLVLVIPISSAQAQSLQDLPKHKYAFWKTAFGEVTSEESELVKKAQRIFERVRAATNISRQHPIRLLITQHNPVGTLLTVSLEDGTIVLSHDALKQILERGRGADKLAFVLGHELAHIENNIKLSHIQPQLRDETKLKHINYFMRRNNPNTKFDPDKVSADELIADKLGILNMIMSGFNPGVIYNSDCQNSFFAEWESLLEQHVFAQYAVNTNNRCDVIAKELSELDNKGQLFTIGLNYYLAGYYRQAIAAYEELLNTYKGKEVFLNLGMAYHRLAIQYYIPGKTDKPVPFQCSMQIDPLYRAKIRGAETKNLVTFSSHINKAIEYYKIAIEKDPAYAAAAANISCAYILAQQYNFAMGYLKQSLAENPHNSLLNNNLAITHFLLGDHKNAEQILEKFASSTNDSSIIYNLGVVALKKHDVDTAKSYFNQLTGRINNSWSQSLAKAGLIEKQPRSPRQPLESINAVKPGMSLNLIKRNNDSIMEYKTPVENVPTLNLYNEGILTLSEGDQVLITIADVDFKGRSKQGIKIGSSLQEVISAYGQPSEYIHTTVGTCLKFNTQQISFFINNNQVTKWMVHLSP